VYALFLMHLVSLHTNHHYFETRHIMMREIIPAEILTDEFIKTLKESFLKHTEPDYKFNKQLEEFFANIRDKYLYELFNINNNKSEF